MRCTCSLHSCTAPNVAWAPTRSGVSCSRAAGLCSRPQQLAAPSFAARVRAAATEGAAEAPPAAASRRRRRTRSTQQASSPADVSPPQASAAEWPAAPTQLPPQQAQQQQSWPEGLPPEHVWQQEIRHLQGLLLDPNKPQVAACVLAQCYALNSPATQAWHRGLSAADMGRLVATRQQLEKRLSAAAHALPAAWRRLQLLVEAVTDQGAVLSEEQLNKEREQLVDVRDRLHKAQVLLKRSLARARACDDAAFLTRGAALQALLAGFADTAEAAYLKTSLRGIGAASRVNAAFAKAWAATPLALRPSPAAAEAQRQAQLQPLLPLLPEPPTRLLGEYKQAAMAFQLYRDPSLHRRPPAAGQPSSTAGPFWADSSAAAHAPAGAGAGGGGANHTAGTAAMWFMGGGGAQGQLSVPPPPLRASEAAWQQSPQQLMARPPQPLPLLPHLTKPWVRQATQLFRQQQQEAQGEQGEGRQQQQLPAPPQAPAPAPHEVRRPLPPLSSLLARALQLEQELVQPLPPSIRQ